MKRTKRKPIPPSRVTVILTALCLLLCAGICIAFYVMTAYLPLLLAGILQAMPAVLNLLLLIPRGGDVPPAAAPAEQEETGEEKPRRRIRAVLSAIAHLPKRLHNRMRRRWAASHNGILTALLATVVIGANVAFWVLYRGFGSPFGIGYHLPVILITIFVLYIVLDKWCKHTDEDKRLRSEEGGEDPIAYDRAMLRGLRGALAAGRWACTVLVLALVIRLMGLKDVTNVAKVLLALLFLYESIFLLISLAVRLIRHELQTAPELSVPMPGLGKGDLGVISYLEKNTGITMRSLWSIRLIKYVLPYAAIAMVVLLWGFSGVVKIEPHQQGAHYRLGHLQEQTLQPGLHMTLPWPFDSVEVYDTEVVSTMTIGYISEERADNIWTEAHGGEEYRLLLGNGNELVSVNLRVGYRIKDLRAYLSYSAAPERLVEALAYETVTARTISTNLDALLATDRTIFSQSFKAELIERMEVYHTGLEITDVVLESIHPPVEIADVYQQLISAEIEADRVLALAGSTAQVALIEANGDSYSVVAKARADQKQLVAGANAFVAEYMGSLAADKSWEGYREYKIREATVKAYGNAQITVYDPDLKVIIIPKQTT